MSTVGSARHHPRGVPGLQTRTSRWVAVAGAVAALGHVPAAVAHAGVSLPLAAGLLLMALVCLPCAGHLWRTPCARTWSQVAALGTAMLLVHAVLLLLPSGPGAPAGGPSIQGHAGHASGGGPGFLTSTGWLVGVSGLTLAQVIGCLVLLGRRPPVGSAVPRESSRV